MGEVVAGVLGRDLKDCAVYGRQGLGPAIGAKGRDPGEPGVVETGGSWGRQGGLPGRPLAPSRWYSRRHQNLFP